jgi:hypothetical protein
MGMDTPVYKQCNKGVNVIYDRLDVGLSFECATKERINSV